MPMSNVWRRSQTERLRRDVQRVGEAPEHHRVRQWRDAALVAGDLGCGVAAQLAELSQGQAPLLACSADQLAWILVRCG
ncbi:hypothetical protein BIV25_10825 [Streptomyces sp. MUSC 14]|nr:hypothetical protein BIV25_10825 [Streptomyces sp. MUSC 14]